MVYISVGTRFLANVEALNMVETVGNISKHRRAPIIFKTEEGFALRYVPAISGESFAHAYQEALVAIAEQLYVDQPPICQYCRRGEFFKSMDNRHAIKEALQALKSGKTVEEQKLGFELETIKGCLVEDIGGFLYAEATPVRRTSRFEVSYIIPVYEAIEATAIEPQFHSRQAPSEARAEESEKAQRAAQMIYYIETASALYGFSFNIDLRGIGRTSMIEVKDAVSREERIRRVKVALGALALTLTGVAFGAKRSRFLPISEINNMIAVISSRIPFSISSPVTNNYIEKTVERVKSLRKLLSELGVKNEIKVLVYGAKVDDGEILKSPEDLMERLIKLALEWLE